MVWVAPLTLLIWVYAEREQIVTMPGVTIPIEVRTSDSNRLVTLRRPPDKLIVVELSGPRASLDRVRDLLKPTPTGTPVQINVDEKLATGGKELLTVREINQLSVFRDNGITVKSAQPPYLFVDIDSYEERDLPIKPSDEAAKKLNSATFLPDTVRVRAPSQLFKTAEAAGQPLYVTADLSKRELNSGASHPERQTLDKVLVSWQHRENVTITPSTVSATVEFRHDDDRYTIPGSVVVFVQAPPDFSKEFDVAMDAKFIPDFTVTGLTELLEPIRKKEFIVTPRLAVSSFDAGKGRISRKLLVDLPPGVSLAPETAKRIDEWYFTVTAK
jgi:hypothetical protein